MKTATRIGRHRGLSAVIAVIIPFVAVEALRAETIFLGPLPYLRAADSPFDLSGLGSTFFLEDFEDGELNTPGISQPGIPVTHAIVRTPGQDTDSVDADDGVLDGFGTDGHSLVSFLTETIPTGIPSRRTRIYLQFTGNVFEGPRNAFGFVWTGGAADSVISLRVFDSSFGLLAEEQFTVGSELNNSATSEDRFLGFVTDERFTYVNIESFYTGTLEPVEIDHVQYGAVVPEAASSKLAIVIIASWIIASIYSKKVLCR